MSCHVASTSFTHVCRNCVRTLIELNLQRDVRICSSLNSTSSYNVSFLEPIWENWMVTNTYSNTDRADRPLTREDVEELLQRVGSSDRLNLEGRNLRSIDLSNLNLARAILRRTDLRDAILSHANLIGVDLSNANLRDADLSGSLLIRANLGGADLSNCYIVDADLSGANLSRAILDGVNLRSSNLISADLSGVDLSDFDLHSVSWKDVDLNKAILNAVDLHGANLSLARLSRAYLSEANLSGADLNKANLRGAILYKVNLSDADLNEADLSNANLNEANLDRAELRGVNLVGATLRGASISLESEKDILRGLEANFLETKQLSEEPSTIHIRIVEEPLTPHNLTTIISALTELSTKFWLIAKHRFDDLIEYSQTHDVRFIEDAELAITRITYNSPFSMDWKIDLSAPSVAEAIVSTIDGITQRRARLEKAELENQAKAQEIKEIEQKSAQERQRVALEREKQELEIESQRLALLTKRLEVQKKGIEYALDIAGKAARVLHPHADAEARAMIIQTLLPNILQIQNGKGLELVLEVPLLLAPKNDEEAG